MTTIAEVAIVATKQLSVSPATSRVMSVGFGKRGMVHETRETSLGYPNLLWAGIAHAEMKLLNSTDHRGTKESPGRVVTVIERKFWETLLDDVSTDRIQIWQSNGLREGSETDF